MAEVSEIQKEALSELVDYSEKLVIGIKDVNKELKEGRKKGTEELLNVVINGINWEIEIFNHCEKIINKEVEKINKEKMSAAVGKLAIVLSEKNDIKIAECLETDFIPFLETLELAALTVTD